MHDDGVDERKLGLFELKTLSLRLRGKGKEEE
jgi:hypothetical protein